MNNNLKIKFQKKNKITLISKKMSDNDFTLQSQSP